MWSKRREDCFFVLNELAYLPYIVFKVLITVILNHVRPTRPVLTDNVLYTNIDLEPRNKFTWTNALQLRCYPFQNSADVVLNSRMSDHWSHVIYMHSQNLLYKSQSVFLLRHSTLFQHLFKANTTQLSRILWHVFPNFTGMFFFEQGLKKNII